MSVKLTKVERPLDYVVAASTMAATPILDVYSLYAATSCEFDDKPPGLVVPSVGYLHYSCRHSAGYLRCVLLHLSDQRASCTCETSSNREFASCAANQVCTRYIGNG